MAKMRERKSWIALLAILLLFAACKGETPTAPQPGPGPGPGPGLPTGTTITLAASNTSPLIDSTVTVTATVTVDGNPAPNGTAVEFTTSNGTFTDTTQSTTIRTTTGGVATATLTSGTAGLARVRAIVNNISATIDVTFRVQDPCRPPDPRCPPVTTPTITSVTPNILRPSGGEIIRITGTNFLSPLRVLFNVGGPIPVEAVIVGSTETTIDVITPAVNLGTGQELAANVTVITRFGSANEASASSPVTFRAERLTPIIYSLSPTSGPINGGTRVTVVGEGFQAPVQVFFGSAEARVIETNFSSILVEAPDGRSTNPDGSGTVTGPVSVSVTNMLSNTRGTSPQEFRYVAAMQITAIRPLLGPATGGTDITIDGIGFDAPVNVLVAGVQAQVIRVSGSQLLVRTAPTAITCQSLTGPVTVTNIENGDTQSAPQAFQYIGVQPQITAVVAEDAPLQPGENIRVTVDDPGTGPLGTGTIRFNILDRTIIPSPSQITDASTPQIFTVAVPLTGFTFPTVACTVTPGGFPGTQLGPVDTTVTFINENTGCTDTATITVNPPGTNACVRLPPVAAQTAPAPGTCANAGTVTVGSSGQAIITFRNSAATGATDLVVTAGTPTGPHAAQFTVTPADQTVPAQGTRSFTVDFTPVGTDGTRTASVVFTTNDPANGTFTICLQGTADAP